MLYSMAPIADAGSWKMMWSEGAERDILGPSTRRHVWRPARRPLEFMDAAVDLHDQPARGG